MNIKTWSRNLGDREISGSLEMAQWMRIHKKINTKEFSAIIKSLFWNHFVLSTQATLYNAVDIVWLFKSHLSLNIDIPHKPVSRVSQTMKETCRTQFAVALLATLETLHFISRHNWIKFNIFATSDSLLNALGWSWLNI